MLTHCRCAALTDLEKKADDKRTMTFFGMNAKMVNITKASILSHTSMLSVADV